MRVYQFADKEYTSLTALCRAHDELVLPPDADAELLAATGITSAERPDPEPTPEEASAQAKALRAAAVAGIVVEVDGLLFDGNEDAQRRMSNALTVSNLCGQETTPWVLADNSVREVSRAQLEKALVLSVQRMAELWMLPYAETAAGQDAETTTGQDAGQEAETESGRDVETAAGRDVETDAGAQVSEAVAAAEGGHAG